MYMTEEFYLYIPNSDFVYERVYTSNPAEQGFKKFNSLILVSNYRDVTRYFKHNKRAYVGLNDDSA